jgi:hypothetical protein
MCKKNKEYLMKTFATISVIRYLLFLLMTLTLTCKVVTADTPSDDELMQEAMVQIKNDLITELKEEHPKLAKGLSGIEPAKVGDFLGSMAGGDYDGAFHMAGQSASDYFVGYVNSHIAEILPDDSPAAQILNYIPLSPDDAKAVYQEVWMGNYGAASSVLKARLKATGTEKMTSLSKDLITGGIDWVLSDTTGGSPGGIFIKLVELEIEFLDFAEKGMKRYFSGEVLEYYNDLRRAGETPQQAYWKTFSLDGRYPMAEINSFGIKEQENVREFAELSYLEKYEYAAFKARQNQVTQQSLQPLKAVLDAEHDRMFQYFMDIAAKYAQNNEQIKKLVGIFAQVQNHMKTLEKNSDQLYSIDTKIEGHIKKITAFNSRAEATLETLATLKSDAVALDAGCGEIAQHERSFETAHDQIATYLDKIRERGSAARDKARNACQDKTNTQLISNTLEYLTKSKREAQSYKADIDYHVKEALTHANAIKSTLGKLKNLKEQLTGPLKNIDEAKNILHNLDTWHQFVTKAYTDYIDAPYQQIRSLLNDPLIKKFAAKAGESLMEQARSHKKPAWEVDQNIKKLMASEGSNIAAFRERIGELERAITDVSQALDACQPPNTDPAQLLDAVQLELNRYTRYLAAFDSLETRVRECSGLEQDDFDPFAEIRPLFAELKGIERSIKTELPLIERASEQAQRYVSQYTAIKEKLSNAGDGIDALVEGCIKAEQAGLVDPEQIAGANAASIADMGKLKLHYALAADSGKEACNYVSQANKSMPLEACTPLAVQAKNAAAASRLEANKALLIAGVIKGRYDNLVSKFNTAIFDQLVREALYRANTIDAAIDSARASLSMLSPESLAIVQKSADEHKDKIRSLHAMATTLASRINKALDHTGTSAEMISGAKQSIAPLVESINQNSSNANAMHANVQKGIQECAVMRNAIETKIAALMQQKIALGTCKEKNAGGDLNELRAASDTAEIFGPYADTKAQEAAACATKIAAICQKIKDAIIHCETDHNCPLDQICGLDKICIKESGGGGFDAGAWDSRENDRQSALGERQNQDNASGYDEQSNHFGGDRMQEINAQNIATLTERNQRDNNNHNNDSGNVWSSSEESSVSSSAIVPTSQSSAPSSSSTASSTSTTGATAPNIGKYYLITESSSYLQRTATCKSVTYTIVGPIEVNEINNIMTQRNAENKKRMAIIQYPLYTAIKVTKSKALDTAPSLPKNTNSCKSCPTGQHIGLDPGKRQCHGN